jgi:hypothetical protein
MKFFGTCLLTVIAFALAILLPIKDRDLPQFNDQRYL